MLKNFCDQLEKLYTNKRLCHGNNLCIANIFMDHFERKYIHPLWEWLSVTCLRLIVWTGSKDQLTTFLNDLNKKHISIKFHNKHTIKYSSTWHETLYKKTNYKKRFIGKKPTIFFSTLIQNTPYHWKRAYPMVKF